MKLIVKDDLKEWLQNTFASYDVTIIEINDETVKTIEKNDELLIFVIEDGKYVFDLLEYHPLGFIRKQSFEKDGTNLLSLLKSKHQPTMLTFNNGGNKLSIRPDQILYLEAEAHYVMIYATSISFRVREKISDLVKRLTPFGFRQVHRSYLVNEKYVIAYSHEECILTGNKRIPLSKKYKL